MHAGESMCANTNITWSFVGSAKIDKEKKSGNKPTWKTKFTLFNRILWNVACKKRKKTDFLDLKDETKSSAFQWKQAGVRQAILDPYD